MFTRFSQTAWEALKVVSAAAVVGCATTVGVLLAKEGSPTPVSRQPVIDAERPAAGPAAEPAGNLHVPEPALPDIPKGVLVASLVLVLLGKTLCGDGVCEIVACALLILSFAFAELARWPTYLSRGIRHTAMRLRRTAARRRVQRRR